MSAAFRVCVAIAVAGCVCSVMTSGSQALSRPEGPTRPPFDPAVAAARELPRLYSLVVSWRGSLVVEHYQRGASATRPANVKSVSKSVMSALVGIALDRGLLRSVHEPIGTYFPELLPAADGARRRITIEDLLTMRSGLETTSNRNYGAWVQSDNWVRHALMRPVLSTPGTHMDYSTGNTHLLSAILTKATGVSTWRFAQDALAQPLKFSLPQWTRDPQGIYFGGNEMLLTPRQMLALGELYLHRGAVEGRQIVPASWIDASFVPRGRSERGDRDDREYGYGWWMRTLAGERTYYAWGYGGQFIFVVPSLDLVVVTTSSTAGGDERRSHRRTVNEVVEDTHHRAHCNRPFGRAGRVGGQARLAHHFAESPRADRVALTSPAARPSAARRPAISWFPLSLALVLPLCVAPLAAEDWPQFRGPDGQGHSGERSLALEWSETRNVRWKVPVPGSGWSSPVVANGRVWLTAAIDLPAERGRRHGVSLRALAFEVDSGRTLVDVELFRLDRLRALNPKNTFASPTPILDGDRVYAHFGADGTAALSTDGTVLWRMVLPYESQHGAGGSPALYGDLLIINCDGNGEEAFVVALDVRTGRERWKRPRRQPADQAYTTPLVIRVGDRDQVISVGAYRAVALDPSTGREIWRVSYGDGFSNVPRPVYGHGLVFIATGFQQPTLIAVRPAGSGSPGSAGDVGDITRTHVAWTLRRGAPLTPSPLLVDDLLYVVGDNGILTCVEPTTGAVRYQQRLGGTVSASPVVADGRIYVLNEDGVTTVLAPGPLYRQLAVNRIDGATLASMAVSVGSFFIRTDRHLYRIAPPAPSGAP